MSANLISANPVYNVIPVGPLAVHREMTQDEGMSLVRHVLANTPDLIGVQRWDCGTLVFKAKGFEHISPALLPWADLADFAAEDDGDDDTVYVAVFMRDEEYVAMGVTMTASIVS